MADSTPKSYSTDPALYLYTSLTSGSSHIVTATSRLETILKANRIPFKALDVATDEKACMLWGRRSGKDESGRVRKLPGLVQMGLVVGDLVEIEDWNEYGELKLHVKIVHDGSSKSTPVKAPVYNTPSGTPKQPKADESSKATTSTTELPKTSTSENSKPPPAGAQPTSFTLAMRQLGEEAAKKAKDSKNNVVETFDGTGKAEPAKAMTKDLDHSAAIPPPSLVIEAPSTSKQSAVETTSAMQSPTSTSWSRVTPEPQSRSSSEASSIVEMRESMQSPTSTAWKSSDSLRNPVITEHRGSVVSAASPEEIKELEKSEAIAEEDEDAIDSSEEEDDKE